MDSIISDDLFAKSDVGLVESKRVELLSEFGRFIEPVPPMNIAEWADDNIYLEKGRYNLEMTPYMSEILYELSPLSPTQKIVFPKSAQCGATQAGLCAAAYYMIHDPTNVMLAFPTLDFARRFSEKRVNPMIKNNPKIADAITMSKRNADTKLDKVFTGGFLLLAGINRSDHVRSNDIQIAMIDELDNAEDIEDEGDIVDLVATRGITYGNRFKLYLASTPKEESTSKIWNEYIKTDMSKYFVPCPHCDHKQVLDFYRLDYDKIPTLYYCEGCGAGIEEHYKEEMVSKGEWRATADDSQVEFSLSNKTRGFHINSMYAPTSWITWDKLVSLHKAGGNDVNKMRVFKNTRLGLPFNDSSSTPKWRELYDKREEYKKGVVPKEVAFIVAGADVQHNRIEASLVGYGLNGETWHLEHKKFFGDPEDGGEEDQTATLKDYCWEKFAEWLNMERPHAVGDDCWIRVSKCVVDSNDGNTMARVMKFCNADPSVSGLCVAFQGVSKDSGTPVRFNHSKGFAVINVSYFKEQFMASLHLNKPTDEELNNGERTSYYCWFPKYEMSERFYKQIVSQIYEIKQKGSRTVARWKQIYSRSETLDCRVYAMAAAYLIGLYGMSEDQYKERIIELMTPKRLIEKVNSSDEGDYVEEQDNTYEWFD